MKVKFNTNENDEVTAFSINNENEDLYTETVEIDEDKYELYFNNMRLLKYKNGKLFIDYSSQKLEDTIITNIIDKYTSYVNSLNKTLAIDTYSLSNLKNELSAYSLDNTKSTPLVDFYLNMCNKSVTHENKINLFQELKHYDLALLDLMCQKNKLIEFVKNCKNRECLLEFEPNFHYLSYSNMRWQ